MSRSIEASSSETMSRWAAPDRGSSARGGRRHAGREQRALALISTRGISHGRQTVTLSTQRCSVVGPWDIKSSNRISLSRKSVVVRQRMFCTSIRLTPLIHRVWLPSDRPGVFSLIWNTTSCHCPPTSGILGEVW